MGVEHGDACAIFDVLLDHRKHERALSCAGAAQNVAVAHPLLAGQPDLGLIAFMAIHADAHPLTIRLGNRSTSRVGGAANEMFRLHRSRWQVNQAGQFVQI